MGPGSTQFLQQILAAGGVHALQLDMGNMINLERLHRRPGQPMISAAIRVERGPRTPSLRHGREFDPLLTLQRWAEEAKILNGEFVVERSGKLVNHVILALLPAAAEARKKAKIAEKEAEEKAALEREEEEKRVMEADEKRQEEQTKAVAETRSTESPAVDVAEELVQLEQAAPVLPEQTPGDDLVMEVVAADQDAPMADVAVVEPPGTDTSENTAEASTSDQPSQRITVMIHGSAVDITDTGIDPTFLEALPDDMREEVLNQHVRDQRAATVERPADSQISAEFLDALPPEIRAEIIQQEAMERAARTGENAGAQPAEATDMDPASFIASLDPTLRQTVLSEQNEGFLQTLPPHILAEAGGYAQRRPTQRNPPRAPGGPGIPAAPPRKFIIDHDAIQLLEKPGIATLVRLLFFPQVSKKSLLFKVLVNVCENAKTRAELFNVLLGILQDGPGELAAVDKSFSQLTVRNTSKTQTPKSIGKHKAASEYLTALAPPNTRIDAVPDLIVQRCLEGLTSIVSANELASLFFLTENELPVGLRRSSSKKGKGKEKQPPQTHYPIVLLLGLLDRQPLIRTPVIMDSLVGLLATITRPLASLQFKEATTTPLLPPPQSTPSEMAVTPDPSVASPQASVLQGEPQLATDAQPGELLKVF